MKLRGALLGAGNIAMRGHLPQWTGSLANDVEITAVADLSLINLRAAKERLPTARSYQSVDDLFANEELDFCDICTPPSTHRPLIELAAARGLHIVCEKPLAHTLEEADTIARVVRESGVVFHPCHQYHHAPQWASVRAALPRIGTVYLAEYDVLRLAANEGTSHWNPRWRTDPSVAGGGILMDHGAHIFYQLMSVFGQPETVNASVRTLRHQEYGVEDTANVVLDFGGRMATVRLTWAARRREIRYRYVGDLGEIVADDQRIMLITDAGEEELPSAEGMSRDSSHSEWFAPLFRTFADRVRSRDACMKPLDEALNVTRLIARAYQSSAEGKTINCRG